MRPICLAVLLLATAMPAAADVVFFDPFDDGDRTDGSDPQDVAWYTRYAAGAVINPSVAVDALNGNNALRVADEDSSNATNSLMLARFPTVSLAVGDALELSFDVRLTNANYPSQDVGFRFGLYHDNGTPVTDEPVSIVLDDTSLSDDDAGYYATVGTMNTRGGDIRREPNGTAISPITGGTDMASIKAAGAILVLLDTSKHTLAFRIWRTTDTALAFEVNLDGGAAEITGNHTGAGIRTTFNEVGITGGFFTNANGDWAIDNVLLTYALAPEPTSLALLLLAGVGLAARPRRR